MKSALVVGVIAALSTHAIADDRYKDDLKRFEERLKTTPPAKAVDKAPAGPPGWCPKLTESPETAGFEIHIDSYYGAPQTHDYELDSAARALCKNDPKEPIVQRAAQEVLQLWMNRTGLSAPDAVESLKLSMDKDGADKGKQQICGALAVNDEVGGAERAFMLAKRELFDCGGETISQVATAPMIKLVPWFDSSTTPPDDIVRLAYVSKEAHWIAQARDADQEALRLPSYVVSQLDFKSLAPDKVLATLDKDPYKGNAYARVTIKEALAGARLDLARIDEMVKNRTGKDADWKELIVTAPQRGIDAWNASAAKYKAELDRSAQFEGTAFGPSKKAVKGCLPALQKDVTGLLKTLKHDDSNELMSQINENLVAGLLVRRYIACMAYDGNGNVANYMNMLKIRVVRGPRQAAYWAAQDALAKIKDDRTKFPVESNTIGFEHEQILYDLTTDLADASKKNARGYGIDSGKGVVKSVSKAKDGMKVVFAKDKQQIWEQTCTPTNRLLMFDHDGRALYYQNCKGKVVTADMSPEPITVGNDLAANITPGKQLVFSTADIHERQALPLEVYADKKGKKLVAWMGINLQ